ncbi:cytoplasmic protein [Desulfatitalea alkaliphila]|uniref:Cytoplasmic protein n=1 Tax=Desulfatitalea alkaliphila TaxID=2929485 RepID=A0AA41R4L3_9BACT|nr:cytoplasmic protein [Desulfatitalea alkaliphila]MCJ8500965.1 cytoplasmic protein [Desulfatitalea alkaliphila]
MPSIALFVFNGDPMCFIHVLLNALDIQARGGRAGIVVEGSATALIEPLAAGDHPLHPLWEKVKSAGLVEGVCRACSKKMGTLQAAEAQGLALLDDMNGHPGMARYREAGYEIITF